MPYQDEHDEHTDLPVKVGHHDPSRGVNLSGFELDMYRDFHGTGGDSDDGGGGFSIREILYVLFRHKFKIVAIFIICALVSASVVSVAPNFYESQSELYIQGDRTSLIIDPAGDQNSFLQSSRPQRQVRSEIAILTGQGVAEKVVERLGQGFILGGPYWRPIDEGGPAEIDHLIVPIDESKLNYLKLAQLKFKRAYAALKDKLNLTPPKLSGHEKALRYVQGNLKVKETMSASNVLRVTYTSHHPEVAQKVLDTLVNAYIEEHIKIHKNQLPPEFFDQKANDLRDELEVKVKERDRLRQYINIMSLQDQRNFLDSEYKRFRSAVHDRSQRIAAAEMRIQLLEEKINERPENATMQTKRQVDQKLLDRLRQLELEKIDGSIIYTSGSVELSRIDRKIDFVKRMIEQGMSQPMEIVEGLDPTRLEMIKNKEIEQTNLAVLKMEKDLNLKEIENLDKLQAVLREHEPKLSRLEQEAMQLERKYQQFIDSKNIAQVAAELDGSSITNVKIIQNASEPIGSTKNFRKLSAVLLFGILMGLGVAIGLAFVLEYFDHTLKTSEDVEKRLGLPVLVSIPLSRNPKPKLLKEAT